MYWTNFWQPTVHVLYMYNKYFLYINGRLSKLRSVHTYIVPRTVYFDWICIWDIEKNGKKRRKKWANNEVKNFKFFLLSGSLQFTQPGFDILSISEKQSLWCISFWVGGLPTVQSFSKRSINRLKLHETKLNLIP